MVKCLVPYFAVFIFVLACRSTPPQVTPKTIPSKDSVSLNVYLTSISGQFKPQTEFSIPDTVYAYLTFPTHFQGEHVLEGLWFAPDGTLQERTTVPVDFSQTLNRTAYVWIRFNEASVLDLAKATMGEKSLSSEGSWTFEARFDGSLVSKSTFTIVEG